MTVFAPTRMSTLSYTPGIASTGALATRVRWWLPRLGQGQGDAESITTYITLVLECKRDVCHRCLLVAARRILFTSRENLLHFDQPMAIQRRCFADGFRGSSRHRTRAAMWTGYVRCGRRRSSNCKPACWCLLSVTTARTPCPHSEQQLQHQRTLQR
jgi:hypothetical protein